MQADSQGFLIGVIIDANKRLLSQQDKSLGYLREIRDGVRDMASSPRMPVVPSGRSGSMPSTPAPVATSSPRRRRGPESLPARGADGKFIKTVPLSSGKGIRKPKTKPSEDDDTLNPPAPPSPGRGSDVAKEIGAAVKDAVGKNVDGVDPVVSAVKEMRDAVSPFGRLFSTRLSPQERRQESWYKRIIQAILKAGNTDALSGKQSGGGFIMQALKYIPRLIGGLLGKVFGGILGRVFGGLGARILGVFSSLAGSVLPMLGRVLLRLLGPIGAAIAGWEVGKWIGEKVYNWFVSSGVEARLFDWIDDMKKSWTGFVDKAAKTWDEITGWIKKKYEFVTDKAKQGYDAAKNAVKQTGRAVSTAAGNAGRAVTAGATRALEAVGLGDLIARGEGGYDSFNHGRAGDARGEKLNISGMTIGEIRRRQKLPLNHPDHLNAVGKYQIIKGTMDGAVTALGLKDSDVFSPELQERIFNEYLIGSKRPEVRDYLSGKSNDLEAAVLAIAKEWRSVADPRTGLTYGGPDKAGNRASTPASVIRAALVQSRQSRAARIPVIPDSPRVALPGSFASASQAPPVVVKIQAPVGQNVSDRAIAHSVTGGLGAQ